MIKPMKGIIGFSIFILSFSLQALTLDTGTGASGACDTSGGLDTQLVAGTKTYNCTSLVIDNNFNGWSGGQAGAGGTIVTIKVQGDVTIDAGISLSLIGQNGTAGDGGGGAKAGGQAGAGGFAGGSAPGNNSNGNAGSGSGAGGGGNDIPSGGPGTPATGAGGGGGSYGTVSTTVSVNGHDTNNSIASSSGAMGSVYGPESSFETSFVGGSGGGAGGSTDNGIGAELTGSAGGGGGGAIHIIAGGNITINGTLTVKGGDGGTTGAATNGSGGGGSGGGIWLQAVGSIIVSGTGNLLALGGARGTNVSGNDGYGGAGGNGRIRLDDSDGVISNSGTITPTVYSVSTATTSGTSELNAFDSSISCGTIDLDNDHWPQSGSFLIGLFLIFSVLKMIGEASKKSNGTQGNLS